MINEARFAKLRGGRQAGNAGSDEAQDLIERICELVSEDTRQLALLYCACSVPAHLFLKTGFKSKFLCEISLFQHSAQTKLDLQFRRSAVPLQV